MKASEFSHIFAAIVVLTAVASFSFGVAGEWGDIAKVFAFSVVIISASVFAKKIAAYLLDADVEHEIWQMSRYGFKPSWHLEKSVPAGVIFPLFFSVFSLGAIKFMGILTYETRALKYRAAKRFGFYSYKEMTDLHNGLIGAAGIFFVLILSIIVYLIPVSNAGYALSIEYFSKMAAFYAFSNIIPFSKLDGMQIFFGSRILWVVLASIATIFSFFAFAVP